MFRIFKKKTKKEKLLALYKKKKEEAFTLSKIDRRKSDEKEKEASDILIALDELDKNEENL
tara:strand:- start:920 stop:1102 length:183 start_codon:yes stop_codon:yes gene_type:complete